MLNILVSRETIWQLRIIFAEIVKVMNDTGLWNAELDSYLQSATR